MILPRTDQEAVGLLGEVVRQAVEELAIPHSANSAGKTVTVSCGGATLAPREGDDPVRLIEIADRRLYRAKQTGKNRVIIAN